MTKSKKEKVKAGLVRRLAKRGVIAALPVAMVAAYSSNLLVPTPPRLSAAEYQMVAEINVSPTTVGIAASPLYGQTYDSVKQQLQDMKDIGVTNIRVFVPWATIEFWGPYDPESWPGTQLWADIDNIMRAAEELDMGVLAEINSTPPHAVIDGPIGSGTPDPAAFASFLQKFIGKYGDVVSAYEVWNEPNYAAFSNPIDPEAYASLLAAAAKVIRAQDPTASVVAGAVGTVQDSAWTMNTLTWVNRMFAQLETLAAADPDWDLDDYFDALSIHPYGEEIPFSGTCPTCIPGLLTPREQFEALTALAALQGKKIWITEYGLPTTPGGPWTEADQETWLKDLLDTWQAYGDPDSDFYDPAIAAMLGPIFLYTGRDTPGMNGEDNPHDYYGLWKQLPNGEWVLKDAGEMLRDWLDAINNPEEPEEPEEPGEPPVDPIAQWFQALAQQIAQALAQAIANWLASMAQPPAPEPAPTTLRVATVEEPEEGSAVETDVATEAEPAADEAATAEPAKDEAATAEPAKDEATAEPVAEVVTETPAEPVAEVTTPAEEPTAEPEAPAEPTTPTEPTTPEPADTSTSAPEAPAGTPKGDDTGSEDTKPDKPADKPDKKAETRADVAKAADADAKKAKDGDTGQGRHWKTRGPDAAGSAKPALAPVGAGAPASDSTSSGAEGE